jgi:hypothetical protein
MKRFTVLLLVALVVPLLTAGCFTRDLDHAHEHWLTFQGDLEEMHHDIDLFFFSRVEAERLQ